MTRFLSALLVLGTLVASVPDAEAQAKWVAGQHYSVLPQKQRTQVPAGKVEVLEVFSHGCPACNHFQPTIKKLKVSLPSTLEAFVQQRYPGSERTEICHNARQIVVHKGWTPAAAGCEAGPGDRVIALD